MNNFENYKKNTLKDFLSIVDLYSLSHMFAITNTEKRRHSRLETTVKPTLRPIKTELNFHSKPTILIIALYQRILCISTISFLKTSISS